MKNITRRLFCKLTGGLVAVSAVGSVFTPIIGNTANVSVDGAVPPPARSGNEFAQAEREVFEEMLAGFSDAANKQFQG